MKTHGYVISPGIDTSSINITRSSYRSPNTATANPAIPTEPTVAASLGPAADESPPSSSPPSSDPLLGLSPSQSARCAIGDTSTSSIEGSTRVQTAALELGRLRNMMRSWLSACLRAVLLGSALATAATYWLVPGVTVPVGLAGGGAACTEVASVAAAVGGPRTGS